MPICLHPNAVTGVQIIPRVMGLNEFGAGELDGDLLYRHYCADCGADWYDDFPMVRHGGLVTNYLTPVPTSLTLTSVNDCPRPAPSCTVNDRLQEPLDG
jgi:hypothetical protein